MRRVRSSRAKNASIQKAIVASAAAAGLVSVAGLAQAGTYNWATPNSDTWSDVAAWDAGVPSPADPTNAIILGQGASANSYNTTNDLTPVGGAFLLNSLTLNTSAADSSAASVNLLPGSAVVGTTTFSTGTVALTGTGAALNVNGIGAGTIGVPVNYLSNTAVTNNSGTFLYLTGQQMFGANATVTFSGANPVFTHGPSNTAQTFANNSQVNYTGSTELIMGPSSASASGAFVFGTGNTVTFSNGLNDGNSYSGNLALQDNGTGSSYSGTNVTINLSNYSSGQITIGNMSGVSGTLNITNGAVAFSGSTGGDLFGNNLVLNVASGASFDFASNPETMGGISGGGTVLLTSAGVTLTEPGDRTFSGVFSGSGGVTQSINSTLTLSGNNTYSGNTTINAGGTINVTGPNVLSPNSFISITTGCTLNLNGFSQTIGGLAGGGVVDTFPIAGSSTLTILANSNTPHAYLGALTGTGALVYSLANGVAGNSVQSFVGNNNFTGPVYANGGTLRLGLGGTMASAGAGMNIGTQGTLQLLAPTNTAFSTPILGTGTLATEGPGTITFSTAMPSANLAGLTVVSGGLTLDHTTDNNPKLGANPALTLQGGVLNFLGNGSAASSQNFNGTNFAGVGTMAITSGSGQSATLNLGAFTRAPGQGAINFSATNLGGGTATFTTTSPTGMLGGWATYGPSDWAVINAGSPANVLAAMPAGSYSNNSMGAGKHTNVSTSFSGSGTTSDVRFNSPTGLSLTLTAASTLTTGGVLVTPNVGTNNAAILGGTLSIPAGGDLDVNQFNPTGTLTITSVINNVANSAGSIVLTAAQLSNTGGSQVLTVPSTAGLSVGMQVTAPANTGFSASYNGKVVSIPSATQVQIAYTSAGGNAIAQTLNPSLTFTYNTGIVKTGAGTLVLGAGTNTLQGLLSIEGGTVVAAGSLQLGSKTASATASTSSIYLNGGTVELTGNYSPGVGIQPWIVGPQGGNVIVDSGTTFTRTGFGFYGGGTFNKYGTGTWSVGSDASGFTGAINVYSGIFRTTSNQLSQAGNVLIANGAQWMINDNGAANWNYGPGAVLTLSGDGPNFNNNNPTPGAFVVTVQSPGPGPTSTLPEEIFLAGDSRVGMYSATFTNTLYGSAAVFSGVLAGPGALIKDGDGTLTLSSSGNNYGYSTSQLGSTIISNGTLALGINNALPPAGVLQFGEARSSDFNSGTLDLKGFNQTVAGLISVGFGTTHAVLNSSGTPSTFAVNYGGASTESFSGAIGTAGKSNLSLVKSGAGQLNLSGVNSYSGSTTITAGTLEVSNGIAGSPTLTVDASAAPAALVLDGPSATHPSAAFVGLGTTTLPQLAVNASQSLASLNSTGTSSFNAGSSTIGSVDGTGAIIVAGGASLATLDHLNHGTLNNNGSVMIGGGTSTINNVLGSGTLMVAPGAVVNVMNNLDPVAISSSGSLNVNGGSSNAVGIIAGPGTLTLANGANIAASSIQQTGLVVGPMSTATIAHDNQAATGGTPIGTSVVTTLSVDSNGTLDLKNNGIVILDTTSLGAVRSLITQAADVTAGTAHWDLPGITSSTAAADPTAHGIGYALASTLPNGGSTSFNGVTFSDAVIARYTLVGDTGLKGTVDLSDYTKVVLNLGKSNASWSDGNFDYSGNVNLGDYTAVIRNLGRSDGQSSVFNASGPSAAQVKASALTLHAAPAVTQASTATDVTLLVNPTNGRVTLVNALQTGQAVITAYTINSPSQSLLPFSADGGGKYLANALENNPSVFYKASNGLTYNLWTGIKNVSTFIGEGFSNHYNANVDSTWTNYTLATSGYALGTLFKRLSSGGTRDLVFQWEDANLNTYTSVVTYVSVPEPASVSLVAMGAMAMLGRRRRRLAK